MLEQKNTLPSDMYINEEPSNWVKDYMNNIITFYQDNNMDYNDKTARYCMKESLDNELSRFKLIEKANGNTSMFANKARGSLLGLMIGDAFGMPLEFDIRTNENTLTEYNAGGPFNLKSGQYTDDSSMMFCLAYSLIKNNGFDIYHQAKSYLHWYKDAAFRPLYFDDIGIGTRDALEAFRMSDDPIQGSFNELSSGNGCIMKLAPVPIFYADDYDKAIYYSEESSRITHQSDDCLSACKYMGGIISALMNGVEKDIVLSSLYKPNNDSWKQDELSKNIYNIALGSFKVKNRDEIKSSGYVVHSLEAALWAFYNSNTFYDGLVLAVNLAGDADTIGAIYGQIAGAYYGELQIPFYLIHNLMDYHHAYDIVDDFIKILNK